MDVRLGALRQSFGQLAQEAAARETKAREADTVLVQDSLRKLEATLRELQSEQDSRGADVAELQKLVGAHGSSYTDVLNSVNEIISREREARLQQAADVQMQLTAARTEHEGLREGLQQSLADHLLSIKSHPAEPQASEKSAAEWLSKAADLELRLTGHQKKADAQEVQLAELRRQLGAGLEAQRAAGHQEVLQQIDAHKEALHAHGLEVQGQLRAHQESHQSQLQLVKEGIASAWKDQLRIEKQAWEQQHESLRDLVVAERDARERSLACLQSLVQRGREDQLRLEKMVRDRQFEALTASDRTSRGHLALTDLIHSEAEEQLQASRDAVARELVAAERSARERSYAALHELLHCENQAMKELVSREREARAVSHSALKDALQSEREVREKYFETHQEELARERTIREKADKALASTVSEQRASQEDKLDQQRIESLERTACIFDGLVRAERAERTAEAKRLWDALDSHTHDLHRKDKALAAAPATPPAPAMTPPLAVAYHPHPVARPVVVSPRPVKPVRSTTPPCTVALPCSIVASPGVRAPPGTMQRSVSPQPQRLQVPALPLFSGSYSVGATPSTDTASPWWTCGSASTQASEAPTLPSPCIRRSSSGAGISPLRSGSLTETITCGTTRYLGEPHSGAEVAAQM